MRLKVNPYVWVVLSALPVFYFIYLGTVSSLVAMGSGSEISLEDNKFLNYALTLNPSHSEGNAAQALYLRNRALLPDNENDVKDLTRSYYYWQEAIKGRPLWPYYQLGALDTEYLLEAPDYVIQERLDWLIKTTPNERGVDRQLLSVTMLAWPKLSSEQQQWLVARFASAKQSDQKYISELAESYSEFVPSLDVESFRLP